MNMISQNVQVSVGKSGCVGRITLVIGGFFMFFKFRRGPWCGSSRNTKQFSCFGDGLLPYELQQYALIQTQLGHAF